MNTVQDTISDAERFGQTYISSEVVFTTLLFIIVPLVAPFILGALKFILPLGILINPLVLVFMNAVVFHTALSVFKTFTPQIFNLF